jgi:hypothetical protein
MTELSLCTLHVPITSQLERPQRARLARLSRTTAEVQDSSWTSGRAQCRSGCTKPAQLAALQPQL